MPWTRISQIDLAEASIFDDCRPGNRILTYIEAVHEALDQAMALDHRVFIMGQGVNDPIGMFGATTDLYKKYGKERVFETALSEAGMMGVAVGSAVTGLRPFYCHNRPDFLMLAMDQIVNHASKLNYMSGGQCPVPMVVWATTGMGWGSAAQHSQALHGLFMHIPGLKIVMPTSPYDVKGLIASSIEDNNPIMFFEHRKLFNQRSHVPKELYKVPIGKAIVRKKGSDVTVIAISHMVVDSIKAANELENEGISVEVIDLRTIKPFDKELILESVKKTGRVVIVDTGWKTGGVTAELSAFIIENAFSYLKRGIVRIGCEDVPTPSSYVLEDAFYKNKEDVILGVRQILE